jgi:hypothetical protein
VAKELKEVSRGSVESLVGFLSKYEGMLGPTNHHIVEVPGFLSHDQLTGWKSQRFYCSSADEI